MPCLQDRLPEVKKRQNARSARYFMVLPPMRFCSRQALCPSILVIKGGSVACIIGAK